MCLEGDVVERASLVGDEDVATSIFFYFLDGLVAIDLGASRRLSQPLVE